MFATLNFLEALFHHEHISGGINAADEDSQTLPRAVNLFAIQIVGQTKATQMALLFVRLDASVLLFLSLVLPLRIAFAWTPWLGRNGLPLTSCGSTHVGWETNTWQQGCDVAVLVLLMVAVVAPAAVRWAIKNRSATQGPELTQQGDSVTKLAILLARVIISVALVAMLVEGIVGSIFGNAWMREVFAAGTHAWNASAIGMVAVDRVLSSVAIATAGGFSSAAVLARYLVTTESAKSNTSLRLVVVWGIIACIGLFPLYALDLPQLFGGSGLGSDCGILQSGASRAMCAARIGSVLTVTAVIAPIIGIAVVRGVCRLLPQVWNERDRVPTRATGMSFFSANGVGLITVRDESQSLLGWRQNMQLISATQSSLPRTR